MSNHYHYYYAEQNSFYEVEEVWTWLLSFSHWLWVLRNWLHVFSKWFPTLSGREWMSASLQGWPRMSRRVWSRNSVLVTSSCWSAPQWARRAWTSQTATWSSATTMWATKSPRCKPEVSSEGGNLVRCTSYNHAAETRHESGGRHLIQPRCGNQRLVSCTSCNHSGKRHVYVHLLQPGCGNHRWVQSEAPFTATLWKLEVGSVGSNLVMCTSYNHCGNWKWIQWEATWLCAPLTATLWKLEVGSVGNSLVMCTSYNFHCITIPLQFMFFFSQWQELALPAWMEAGDVWCHPPVWNLRAIIWFPFPISCLVFSG